MEQEQQKNSNTETNQTSSPDLRLSGDDIIRFLRKIFKAGYSRMVVLENEEGKKIFKINLILLLLIFFFIPIIALIFLVVLITADYALSVRKKS